MKIDIYDSITIIDENKVLVNPVGLTKDQIESRIKAEKLINSGKYTKSGKEYVNFAPKRVFADVKFMTAEEFDAAFKEEA